ncbi:MAG: 4-hydroxy-tetrahydrodipicolinate synthase [Rhodobacteraceae bacterium]|nr:4-hydroxy-tetrahydrodipicolinate synthase [Paracoccaceae bacterium]MXZ51010.1 4-hydroxy-tetrahydrodipicolinate synthase [Paracoccaceae bacterium]MYF45988.1 4-hydroxy-tetrahydrodipicolinate synthase [Paracoccaceae bacterium]MYG09429.1 4-hydroxy-tetrahydrodipicolinate synthase [Paracoccaceae bacterium]MYI92356.1 4-hydroxy-tetrahydrodipicolinate synthase [Paracoccaceae bacterium]
MFSGSLPALVTPFNSRKVDWSTLEALVKWHITEGSNGIVAVGTTGESPTLSHQEHEEVFKAVIEYTGGRIPVIAGAGSNSTEEALGLVQAAEETGADAVLVVTPYYNKPTQTGLYEHYRLLHDNSNIPIIIYNIPGRSVIDMIPSTMGQLAKLPRIIGVKDATGDIVRVSQQREACGKDFLQLSGEDASALGFNAHGGRGCISVTANVAPGLCSEFQQATLQGDYQKALQIQDKLLPLHTAIFIEPGLVGAKFGLSVLGRCSEEVRLPLTPLAESTKQKIIEAMKSAGIID